MLGQSIRLMYAPGDFSASALQTINLKAETAWSTGAQSKNLVSRADAAVAVLQNQTARFEELSNKDKDLKVKLTWLNPCGITAKDCTPNCDIQGTEIESEAKEYEYDMCKETDFAINRDTLRTNAYDRDDLIAIGMAKAVKVLDEWWAQQVLLKLKAYAGVNVDPSPWTFDAANLTTLVPMAQWNLKGLYARLIRQAMKNEMNSPYYIEKGDLFDEITNARIDSGNSDGSGDANRANQWNSLTMDLWNFAKAGITEDLFAIDQSAVAIKTHALNPDAPTTLPGKVQQTIYTIDSQILPGVKYDVFYGFECRVASVGGKQRTQYVDSWKLQTNGLIALNPAQCPVTIGGVTYRPNGVMSYSQQ